MKLTKRKYFSFLRSYFDVYNELTTDKEKVQFIDALLDHQFLGKQPEGLTGMARMAYVSQMHKIEQSVEGFQHATGLQLTDTQATLPPPNGDPQRGATRDPGRKKEVRSKKKELIMPTKVEFKEWVDGRYGEGMIDLKKLWHTLEAWRDNGWVDFKGNPIQRVKAKILNLAKYEEYQAQNNDLKI